MKKNEMYENPTVTEIRVLTENGFAESFGTEPIEQAETDVPW